MRTSQMIRTMQQMMLRKGDRKFTVQVHVNGKPVAEVPRMNLVARNSLTGGEGTLGLDLHLDVPGWKG